MRLSFWPKGWRAGLRRLPRLAILDRLKLPRLATAHPELCTFLNIFQCVCSSKNGTEVQQVLGSCGVCPAWLHCCTNTTDVNHYIEGIPTAWCRSKSCLSCNAGLQPNRSCREHLAATDQKNDRDSKRCCSRPVIAAASSIIKCPKWKTMHQK